MDQEQACGVETLVTIPFDLEEDQERHTVEVALPLSRLEAIRWDEQTAAILAATGPDAAAFRERLSTVWLDRLCICGIDFFREPVRLAGAMDAMAGMSPSVVELLQNPPDAFVWLSRFSVLVSEGPSLSAALGRLTQGVLVSEGSRIVFECRAGVPVRFSLEVRGARLARDLNGSEGTRDCELCAGCGRPFPAQPVR